MSHSQPDMRVLFAVRGVIDIDLAADVRQRKQPNQGTICGFGRQNRWDESSLLRFPEGRDQGVSEPLTRTRGWD